MRLTTVLLIASLMHVSAAGIAQRITLKKSNAPLTEVLKEIRDQSGYDIIATGSVLKNAALVTVSVKNMEIDQAMSAVLRNQNLEYTISDKKITVREKESPSILDKLVDKVSNYFASIEVHGRVVDENGKPIPGVSIKSKESNEGTISNANGEFLLRGVKENELISFSYIGYKTLEVSAKPDLGNLRLEMSLSKLDEVQVVAYRETTRRINTGNVTTVTSKDIEKSPVTNVLQALANRVPGLNFSQVSGFNNGGVFLDVQGQNSIYSGTMPFIVIDGVPYPTQMIENYGSHFGQSNQRGGGGNPLNYLNPNDIESVTILKDADATAIYGSQAANGAILIRTKKGVPGKTKVDINLQQGWSGISRGIEMMNTQQYLQMRREAIFNDKKKISATDYDLNGHWDTTRYTDWKKLLLENTMQFANYNASISGGSKNTTYLFGTTYNRQTTVFPGSFNNQKGSAHLSINKSSENQRLNMQFTANFQRDYNFAPGTNITSKALLNAPNAPEIYNPDGTFNWAPTAAGRSTWDNPIAMLRKTFTSNVNNLVTNGVVGYEVLKGLSVKANLGYNLLSDDQVSKIPLESSRPESITQEQTSAGYANTKAFGWIVEPQISYKTSLKIGEISFLVGSTIQQRQNEGHRILGTGYLNNSTMDDINSATTLNTDGSIFEKYKYFGNFANINYNYGAKYLINLSARRDGSSRFGPKNRYHTFGALGLGWVFSEETWLKNSQIFSFGKFRFSYGTAGNDQIAEYGYFSRYTSPYIEVPYGNSPSLYENRLTNPYIQWEETRKINFGLDLGFAKDKVLINANFFRNKSSNQLTYVELSSATGSGVIMTNLDASVRNQGLELAINGQIIDGSLFKWRSQFNLTLPSNKLLSYNDDNYFGNLIVGESVKVIKAYEYTGVDPKTGLYTFKGSDGLPTSTPNYATDRTKLIDVSTRAYGGFENTFSYGPVSLSFLVSFVKRNAPNVFTGDLPGRFNFNNPTYLLDRWQKEGDNAGHQRYNSDFSTNATRGMLQQSDRGYSDASYARLKNVSLSWVLPEKILKPIGVTNARLFFQAQNLFTVTNYFGVDPETTSNTLMMFPTLKTMTIGLQASF